MFAIILKDLHGYANSHRYRRIQFLILCSLALLLFVATTEFYAGSSTGASIDVGKQTYTLFIVALFMAQFLVPRHAVEAMHMEQAYPKPHRQNGALLALAPLENWKILAGKLIAVVFWATWGIWLAVPLLALSSYIGGLALAQWVRCGVILLMGCIFFALVGTGMALWMSPIRAKAVSYGLVLFITFLPFIPSFKMIPMLAAMSPLCALLSILRIGPVNLWIWNVGLFAALSCLIFPLLVRRNAQ